MQAMLLVLKDKAPFEIQAVYIHGSSVKNEELDTKQIELGVELFENAEAAHIVIAGTPKADCTAIAYAGVEPWHEEINSCGIREDQILHTPPVKHTAAECKELVKMAEQYKWESVTIVALPHHVLRVMRTWVGVLNAAGSNLKVYAQTIGDVDWRMPASKPVLDAAGKATGEMVEGTFFDHIAREFAQGERFENKAGQDELGKFTPHATLAELIEYYAQRDAAPAEVEAPAETRAQVPEQASA